MGFPHPPHPKETVVLSRYFGDTEARTYTGWVKRGGYDALKQALGMPPDAITEEVKASGLRGRGGGGVPPRLQRGLLPQNNRKPPHLLRHADESGPRTLHEPGNMRRAPPPPVEGCA